jgi:hypothetical protein
LGFCWTDRSLHKNQGGINHGRCCVSLCFLHLDIIIEGLAWWEA